MKHLHIPIEEVENKIKAYRHTLNTLSENNLYSHDFYRTQGMLTAYEKMLEEYQPEETSDAEKEYIKENPAFSAPYKTFNEYLVGQIAEAAKKYCIENNDAVKTIRYSGFIAGAISDAAREYWQEKL